MEELVAVLLQVLLELLIDIGLYWPWDSASSRRKRGEPKYNALTALVWAALGGVLGGLSLFVLPNLLIQNPTARIVNLFVTPLFAGIFGFLVSALRSRKHPAVTPKAHFWFAVWFSLAFSLVRFAYAPAA